MLYLFVLLLLPTSAATQDFEIPWHTIDAGGEIVSSGGEWTLSGTIGQWDVETTAPQEGGSWSMTGGFWVLHSPELNLLFKDGFED